LKRKRREIFIRVNLEDWSHNSNQQGFDFFRLPLSDEEGGFKWTTHSDPAVDACINSNAHELLLFICGSERF
jgi:hypothetical protein